MYNVLVDKNNKVIFDGTRHGNGSTTDVDGGLWQLVNEMPVTWNPWVSETMTGKNKYKGSKTGLAVERYEVFTLDGKPVMAGQAHGATADRLPLGALPGGVYILKTIAADGTIQTGKIIRR